MGEERCKEGCHSGMHVSDCRKGIKAVHLALYDRDILKWVISSFKEGGNVIISPLPNDKYVLLLNEKNGEHYIVE